MDQLLKELELLVTQLEADDVAACEELWNGDRFIEGQLDIAKYILKRAKEIAKQ